MAGDLTVVHDAIRAAAPNPLATARNSIIRIVLENAAMPAVNKATLLGTAPSGTLVFASAKKISRVKTRTMSTVSVRVVSIGTFLSADDRIKVSLVLAEPAPAT